MNKFQPGDSIHCWVPSESYMAQYPMFYLGIDSSNIEKALVPHKTKGWDIVPVSIFPEDGVRRLDRANFISEGTAADGKSYFIKVLFWYVNDKVSITCKIEDGLWMIEPHEFIPSWLKTPK